MANAQTIASQTAINMITTALQSGSIKLVGVGTPNAAAFNANADATYLKTLISELSKAIQAQE